MESKTSFFNTTIYKKTLKRLYPWGICYALILLFSLPLNYMMRYHDYKMYLSSKEISSILMNLATATTTETLVFVFAAALLAAGLIYSFMFKDTSVNMMHALPVTKPGLVFTNFVAGMTLLCIPVVLAEGINALFLLAVGAAEASLLHFQLLIVMLLVTLCFFAIATFCSVLSGSVIALPVIYMIVNFLSLAVCALIAALKGMFYYGVSGNLENTEIFTVFSPFLKLWSRLLETTNVMTSDDVIEVTVVSIDWKLPLIYGAAGILLLLLAMYLYKLRRAERAGDILAFPKTAWFFQTLGAVAAGLLSVLLFDAYSDTTASDVFIILEFLLGGIIGFIVIYMFIRKRFNIFRDVWKNAAVFTAAAFAFLLLLHFDIFGTESYVPKAEEVASAGIAWVAELADDDCIADCIRLHQSILNERDALQTQLRDQKYPTESCYVSVCYTLKNGKTVQREYEIPVTADTISTDTSVLMQYYDIINRPENVMRQMLCRDFDPKNILQCEFDSDIYGYQELTNDQCEAVGKAIAEDIRDGNILYDWCYSLPEDGSVKPANSAYDPDSHRYYEQWLQLEIYCPAQTDKDTLSEEVNGATTEELTAPYTNTTLKMEMESNVVSRYISLEESMTHTIACLTELGLITEEKPLLWQDEIEY